MKSIIGLGIAAAASVLVAARKAYKNKHYNSEGFNSYGYNKEGYDKEGYNCDGYDREGYNRDGYNIEGYNREGYNAEGYDKRGYNREGFNLKGYDKNGYDREGYDEKGFDIEGYNKEGLDLSGYDAKHYRDIYSEMGINLKNAKNQIKGEQYKYAMQDIRIGLEKGIKCVICHFAGEKQMKRTLDQNITYCKQNTLLDKRLIKKLYAAKNSCNSALHDNKENNYKKKAKLSYNTLRILRFNVKPIFKSEQVITLNFIPRVH